MPVRERVRALCTMLTSSGPANKAGNNVSTSIFMPMRARADSTGLAVLDDLHRAAQPLLGAAGQQQRSNRVDGHSLPPDDLSHVGWIHAQFVDRHAVALHRRDAHLVGMLHESFNDKFEKGLHEAEKCQAVTAAALFAFRMKLATVSLGCAPWLTQYRARSRSSVTLSPFLSGW